MPGYNTIGNQTKTTFLNTEAHKLSLEFVANAAVKSGQPVKLTNDGKVTPWAKTDALNLCIGYAYQSADANEYVTVFVRGYLVIWALSTGTSLNAGPVALQGYDSSTDAGGNRKGYSQYGAVSSDTASAWALDAAAAANTLIRVLVMG